MSSQSPTANSHGQGPKPPFDREDDKKSPTQDEAAATDEATGKPDYPKARQKRGNREPDEQKGFGQDA